MPVRLTALSVSSPMAVCRASSARIGQSSCLTELANVSNHAVISSRDPSISSHGELVTVKSQWTRLSKPPQSKVNSLYVHFSCKSTVVTVTVNYQILLNCYSVGLIFALPNTLNIG